MSFDKWLDDKSKIILFDGGMGSEVFKRGIKPGKLPDLLNIEHAEIISEIHEAYYDAGSDMCQTNTFGASYLNLKNYKQEEKIAEINTHALSNIKKVCPAGRLIVGDIGPSGAFKPPIGKVTLDQWKQSYLKQVEYLEEGVDLWHIETISDIDEMLSAVDAIRQVSKKPIMSSMTYKITKRGIFTIMGNALELCVNALEKAKVDVIGANCTLGSKEMVVVTKELKKLTQFPISIKPNAGQPRVDGNNIPQYDQPIEDFVNDIKQIIDLGAKIVGGCCGTSPDTIIKIRNLIDKG